MRLFRVGCIMMILTCVLHLFGHFSDTPPANDSEKKMMELMTNYRLPIGVTMMDLMQGFSLFFALSLLGFGYVGLTLIEQVDSRRLMWTYCFLTGAMAAIGFAYFFLAPTVFLTGTFLTILVGALTEAFAKSR